MSAEKCVRCGRCLTVCPTYLRNRKEKRSSRGRLALIEARREGRLAEDTDFRKAMSACLLCGACERTCTNGVNIREQIISARAGMTGGLKRLALAATSDPGRLEKAARTASRVTSALGLPGDSGLRIRFPGRPRDKDLKLPPLAAEPLHRMFPRPQGPADGPPVILFPGCLASHSLTEVGRATMNSLAAAGYRVHLPAEAGCCGLPAAAAGLVRLAEKRAVESTAALQRAADALPAAEGPATVVFLCASCGRRLKETVPRGWDTTHGPLPRLIDLAQALEERWHHLSAGLKAIDQRVTFHDPCHSLGPEPEHYPLNDAPATARRLMKRLPGLEFVESNAEPTCCGFGGLFSVAHPKASADIGRDKGKRLARSGADAVATSCPACLLRLRELAAGQPGLEAVHLAELTARRVN